MSTESGEPQIALPRLRGQAGAAERLIPYEVVVDGKERSIWVAAVTPQKALKSEANGLHALLTVGRAASAPQRLDSMVPAPRTRNSCDGPE